MTASPEPKDDAAAEPRSEDQGLPPTTDRGISPIAGRFGGRGSKVVTLAALGLGCSVFLFATWDRGEGDDQKAADEPARQVVPFEPARRDTEPPLLTDQSLDPDAPILTSSDEQVPALETSPSSSSNGPSVAERRQTLIDEARRSPVLAYSSQGSGVAPTSGLTAAAVAPGTSAPIQARVTPLDGLRQTSPIGEARAGQLGDRNLLLTAGASIPCILQTAMDSATPGFVSCILPRDVYSESGTVVLMERGTRVLGEYQGGLQQGRNRLFVLWTRAVTPTGVTVGLASPAADALGRAGFDGRVDTHFWDRFGGALLLSLVDDGLYAAVGRDGAVRETARLPSDAAGVALQNSVDIPATLRKPQGAEVSIFVAQDLNFAGVYRLSAR
ncbi:type IV secretion system protein VirB10 [Brevundimonas variabilis]|uniref:Type IV secretion system protein VirB10 n=1 Tax=Brevundimonas variabilis TaxID=74312 RepID=A0A7W9CK43_9CAUL|nr:type IV secretion system protein VirB10 [Brevundimonas variabilis]MBB5747069.1 type IV secretion system protein VirB10 [Brevundimonas variabilis]